MNKIIALLLVFGLISSSYAQEGFPVNGPKQNETDITYAFTGVTLWVDYQTKVEQATLLVRNGRVLGYGVKIHIPAGSVVYPMAGKTIYPSFIELNSDYGMPEEKKAERDFFPQLESKKEGAYYWNESIQPERNASYYFKADEKKAGQYRSAGFGAVVSHVNDGIARGTGTLVSTGTDRNQAVMIASTVSSHFSFQKGSSNQTYPSSLMGSIALLKQSFLDAAWYKSAPVKDQVNLSLEAYNAQQELPHFFHTRDLLEILRADLVGDEYDYPFIMIGNGDEYQRIDALKATKAPVVVPVNFPKAYDVEDPYDAFNVSLKDMKHWELAPYNLKALQDHQIPFAVTTKGLEEPTSLIGNLKTAVKKGLTPENAIKALTYTPAQLIGQDHQIGALKSGYIANFIIVDGDLFGDGKLLQNWVQGKGYELANNTLDALAGKYELKIGRETHQLKITSEGGKVSGKIAVNDSVNIDLSLSVDLPLISFNFKAEGSEEAQRFSGHIDGDSWSGKGQKEDGVWIKWSATKTGDLDAKEKDKEERKETVLDWKASMFYPFEAYGWKEKPQQENTVFRNATVWTNEAEGVLTEADVWIKDGKIKAVGVDLKVDGDAKEFDAKGLHITSGIIDEHSHIAISRGVNEGGQNNSAEVSISDVVNSEDVNIYRQLSGGVTAAHLLHGSANPIGGHSALIKLRWGGTPEEMKIKNTPGFIKFALGENVKQSNWGQFNTVRYPQTRMGVEQVYYDAFMNAKKYEQAWKDYNALSKKEKATTNPPRKDLEMETMVQILNSQRFVSCHSYVQSEINMLMNVADSMGFTLNTFTHILEGYKLADKMKAHGAGGSTFSDWWAYKFEVNDAIPYNAAIMHRMGVVTAINSDDAEMARRLNQEAAKIVKYGGVSEEEAWKMVTLNPAKLLHLDNRMGSLKPGKDADIVVWTNNPLSIYAKAQKTYVDGRCYFDLSQDILTRNELAKERNRLIQAMIAAKNGGAPTQKGRRRRHHLYHCDDLGEEHNH